jgi:hypothetical protein
VSLAALIEEAKGASPGTDCGQKWRRLWPLYQTLRGRGLTCKQAVAWMVGKKEIAEADTAKALDAFFKMATRRNKKAK